jgi:hypothetical protein
MTYPNFLIIGAMRCGTTSLARALAAHPDVFVPPAKELHFFDSLAGNPIEYAAQFELGADRTAIGEATPAYMYLPSAVERMHRLLPGARLIVLLREPVARAYSHYWHNRARGHEHLDFLDAIAAEESRLMGSQSERLRYSYLDRGRYLRQLEDVSRFYPEDQLLVLLFEELVARPETAWAQVCAFLDVSGWPVPTQLLRRTNSYQEFRSLPLRKKTTSLLRGGRISRGIANLLGRFNRVDVGYAPLPLEENVRLQHRFADENDQLEVFLGRELDPWWHAPARLS